MASSAPDHLRTPGLISNRPCYEGIKILHRKRRDLIPILDNVVMRHYVGEKGVRRAQNKIHAPGIGMECLGSFRTDLAAAGKELQTILDSQSFRLTGVRALEALIWMEVEPSGSYRT